MWASLCVLITSKLESYEICEFVSFNPFWHCPPSSYKVSITKSHQHQLTNRCTGNRCAPMLWPTDIRRQLPFGTNVCHFERISMLPPIFHNNFRFPSQAKWKKKELELELKLDGWLVDACWWLEVGVSKKLTKCRRSTLNIFLLL